MKRLYKPEEVVDYFKNKFKTEIKSIEIKKRLSGLKKNETSNIWMKVEKDAFKNIIRHLCSLQFPHLSVVSGSDLGDTIELIYHFTINYGERLKEIVLNISVELPKSNPEIETICDYIPGALVTEREKQEMLGIRVIGIPDGRRCFLPEDFPKDVYPWRRDEKGADKLYKNLHEVGK